MADREKLTALAVKAVPTKAGYVGDGGGLYLQITKRAPPKLGDAARKPADGWAKSWVFRYRDRVVKKNGVGVLREIGLGPLADVSLKESREKAADLRKLLLNDQDPKQARVAARQQAQLDAAKAMTFDQCAAAYIESHKKGWSNPKHGAQWESTLASYASPHFGALLVKDVDTALVMKALRPIWDSKNETASRVRGRVESVLSWATVQGYRVGDNPARWRGHLDHLLPKPSSVQKVEHHAALPYNQIGAFAVDLRSQSGVAAMALEFAILTAARTGEVIGATRNEFDLDKLTWIIPAARMKAKKEHRVPLSPRAAAIIKDLLDKHGDTFVFPGMKEKTPLSNMAMLALLKRMDRSDLTTHGFRSTFRDWAAEATAYPGEVVEMALAHTIGNKVEEAYRRGDLFEKRRRLMDDWAAHCDRVVSTGDNVRGIREAA
jgi:integrase